MMDHRHKHKTTEHQVLGGGEAWDLELDKEFMDLTQNTQSTQEKIDDLDFMETESCLLSEQFLKNEKLGLERGLSG